MLVTRNTKSGARLYTASSPPGGGAWGLRCPSLRAMQARERRAGEVDGSTAAGRAVTRKPSVVNGLRAQVSHARRSAAEPHTRGAAGALHSASTSGGSAHGSYEGSDGYGKGAAWHRSAQAVVGELRGLLAADRGYVGQVQVRRRWAVLQFDVDEWR